MRGKCLCEGVQYEVRFRTDAVYYCHCSQCRRANGSGFAANVAVSRQDIAILQGGELVKSYCASPGKHRNFCSSCGSPLYSEYLDDPDIVYLRIGTLDNQAALSACAHIHVSGKAPWYRIRDDLPQHAGDADVVAFSS